MVPLTLLASASVVVVRAADNGVLPFKTVAVVGRQSLVRESQLPQRAQLSASVSMGQISKKQLIHDRPVMIDRSGDESPETLLQKRSDLAEQPSRDDSQ